MLTDRKTPAPTREEAQVCALHAVAFIVGEPQLSRRFFALTGLSPASLKEGLEDVAILAAVLDFLLGHEPDLAAFAEAAGVDAARVATLKAQMTAGRTEGA